MAEGSRRAGQWDEAPPEREWDIPHGWGCLVQVEAAACERCLQ